MRRKNGLPERSFHRSIDWSKPMKRRRWPIKPMLFVRLPATRQTAETTTPTEELWTQDILVQLNPARLLCHLGAESVNRRCPAIQSAFPITHLHYLRVNACNWYGINYRSVRPGCVGEASRPSSEWTSIDFQSRPSSVQYPNHNKRWNVFASGLSVLAEAHHVA